MQLIINAPEDNMESYLEEVLRQVGEGCTSGHVDRNTHWSVV